MYQNATLQTLLTTYENFASYQIVKSDYDEDGGEGAAHAGAVERAVGVHLGGGGQVLLLLLLRVREGVHKWDDKHCSGAAVM